MNGLLKRREAFGRPQRWSVSGPRLGVVVSEMAMDGHFRIGSSLPSNRLSNVAIHF